MRAHLLLCVLVALACNGDAFSEDDPDFYGDPEIWDRPDFVADPDIYDDGPVVDTTAVAASRLFAGTNSDWCVESAYNCRFRRPGISQRVTTASGLTSWGIAPGVSIRDGDGNRLATETRSRLRFNYGQDRVLAGKAHALALSTANGSAGWFPIDHILGETSFRKRVGEVNARDPHRNKMACYEVRDSHPTARELRKVVYDSKVAHERAGDYMALVRNNGKRSANLIFSVPGFGLGGSSTDHFAAGTKFRRVSVPTHSGRPSITIPLWVADSAGRYRKRRGSMRFFYGYVVGNGVKRFGWMAQDALRVSVGCP